MYINYISPITKEDIFASMQKQCDNYDDYEKDIDNKIREYEDNAKLLDHFILIKPFKLSSHLEVNDHIRFLRSRVYKLSCIYGIKQFLV